MMIIFKILCLILQGLNIYVHYSNFDKGIKILMFFMAAVSFLILIILV